MQPKTILRVEAEEPPKRLAVLIDADNAQAAGARTLPPPIPTLMKLMTNKMKAVAYRI